MTSRDPDPRTLLDLADLVTPMAIRAAAMLRIPDHVNAGAHSVTQLARATSTHPRTLAKLMAHLATSGIVGYRGDQEYSLTPLGELLLSENDALAIRPTLDANHLLGRIEWSVTGLVETIQSGDAAYRAVYGRDLWEDINDGMPLVGSEALNNAVPAFDAQLITDDYDWHDIAHVVDVGGNTGAILIDLLAKHPHLHGTLLDLPRIAQLGEQRLRAAGLSSRCTVVSQSFFDPLPAGADVYLLSSVLADWNDTDALHILSNCRRAVGPSDRVLLSEVRLTGHDLSPDDPTRAALRLEVDITHPDRSVDELRQLATHARFFVTKTWQTRFRTLLDLHPC